MGQKQKTENNTPGTAGGPGGRDRTLAVKSRKIARKSFFFRKKIKLPKKKKIGIYLLVMPKYWGNKFSESFSEGPLFFTTLDMLSRLKIVTTENYKTQNLQCFISQWATNSQTTW